MPFNNERIILSCPFWIHEHVRLLAEATQTKVSHLMVAAFKAHYVRQNPVKIVLIGQTFHVSVLQEDGRYKTDYRSKNKELAMLRAKRLRMEYIDTQLAAA